MKRYAGQVTVNFDPDAGGSRGAERSIEIFLNEMMRVKILELDEDADPDEYIQKHGAEVYQALVDKAPSYYFWLADVLRKRHPKTAEGRSQVLQQLLPAILKIPDRIERAGLADDLASYLGVEKGLVLEQFRKGAMDRREQAVEVKAVEARSVEKILLLAVVNHPGLRGEILPALRECGRMEELRTWPLWEAVFQVYGGRPDFGYEDLAARVSEGDQALLSRLVFADEMQETDSLESARANALACLGVLRQERKETQVKELRKQIKDAEQRGDLETALRLTEEVDRYRRGVRGSTA
jgi:DNA primase